jgi:hypothetical protein
MLAILMALVVVECAHGNDVDSLLLADFDTRQLSWTTVNDNVMGGRSQGGFEIEDGMLLFHGTTNTDGGGFSSIRSGPGAPVLEGREAIRLRVRGDGRTYSLRLDTGRPRGAYRAAFGTVKDRWTEARLPFESFIPRWRGRKLDLPPPEPADVIALGFMIYDKQDGPFRLEVDWIRADNPFSLSSLEWERRPLVIIAPGNDDPRLKKQLEAVEESKDEFDERDMVLVIVAPEAGLSTNERRAIRLTLEVEDGTFAVCLLGKDGSLKRRSSEPVPMKEIFEQIDRMPMRRSEMEERGSR